MRTFDARGFGHWEPVVHVVFKHHRCHGEWFDETVLHYIEEAMSQGNTFFAVLDRLIAGVACASPVQQSLISTNEQHRTQIKRLLDEVDRPTD